MRIIVLVLFLLAAGKIGTQIYLRQSATAEAIVMAYRDDALTACSRVSRHVASINGLISRTTSNAPYATADATGSMHYGGARAAVYGWSNPDIELVIGRNDIDVRLWQTSHRNWSARYRDPFLIVNNASAGGADQPCEYDIKRRSARLLQGKAQTTAARDGRPAS